MVETSFASILEIVESSKIFKDLKEKNPGLELVAGFFILDLLGGINERSLDYKLDEKIFTFSLDNDDELIVREDTVIKDPRFPALEKIMPRIKIDLDKIPFLAKKAAFENKLDREFQKIIAILQIYEKKQVWNLTCILDGLVIINIVLDSDSGKLLKFEKKNIADFIKKD